MSEEKTCGFNLQNELVKYALSEEETQKLYDIILNGTKTEQFEARQKLAEGNFKLASVLIQRFGIVYNVEDFLQEGCMGIWEAAQKYIPDLQSRYTGTFVKFDSYAYWWAQARIVRALANSSQCRIPANKKSDFVMVRKALEEISINTGCSNVENLSAKEIAEFMNSDKFVIFRKSGIEGIPGKKKKYTESVVKEALGCYEPLSLDASVCNESDKDDVTSTYNFIEDENENIVDEIQTKLMGEQLWETLSRICNEKEMAVLRGVSEDKSYADISRELNVSREYVRKIFARLKSKLALNTDIINIKNYM